MPPDSSAIDAALLALLGSDAELLALMPNGVYWEEAPPGATRFVRVSLADATDEAQFGGRAIEDIVYLIEAVALSSTNADVRGAAARIDVLLEDQPLTAPGYAMMSMARDRRVRATEVDPIDPTLRWYHRGGWYRVQMAVSTASSVWRPHAPTHAVGGGDTVNVTTLGGYPGGTTKFLRADGTFAVPAGGGGGAGTGDVVGPGASTAGHVATFDDDTGTVLADDGIALASLVLTTDPRLSNARAPTVHAATHAAAGSDPIAIAESQVTNLVTDLAGKASATDPRFTDARPPIAHALTHRAGGADAIRLDELAVPTDVTTLNASVTAHGLLPKLPGGTSAFLRADGAFAIPSGTTPSAHAATHASGGSDAITIAEAQVTNLVADLAGKASTADPRFTDARPPTVHAPTHKAGGSDAIKLDELAAPTDVTTLNASLTAHGLLPKLPGGTTTYLRADGTFAAPTATAGPHAATHAVGGGDTVSIATLGGYPGDTATFLRADGQFVIPPGAGAGGGTVNGPATTVVGRVATWNNVTGTLLADGGVLVTSLVLTTDLRLSDARTPTAHAASHVAAGSDPLTIAEAQVTNLVTDLAGKASTTDPRLSDARTPTAHAPSHQSGGTDALALDTLAPPTDVTTLNVSTAAHGLAPKLPGTTTTFLRGDGTYAIPTGVTPSAHAATHAAGGGDAVTITEAQVTNLVSDLAGKAATTDPRFSDARTPTAHAGSHESGGSDPIPLDLLAPPTDVTTLNASTAAHGLLPKLPGGTTTFLRGDGTYAAPPAGTGTVVGPGSTVVGRVATWNNATGTLLADGGVLLSSLVTTADARLSDARTPTAHATSHKSGGSDAIKLDELAAPTDITTLNVSTAAHGLAPKLSNNANTYLTGTGTYASPDAVVTLIDGATPALDASQGSIFRLAAAGDRTIAAPTNPRPGQKIVLQHFASGAARTLALNTSTNGFRFGSEITGLTQTVSGKTDYIGAIWNNTDSKWDVVAYAKGY